MIRALLIAAALAVATVHSQRKESTRITTNKQMKTQLTDFSCAPLSCLCVVVACTNNQNAAYTVRGSTGLFGCQTVTDQHSNSGGTWYAFHRLFTSVCAPNHER